MLIFSFRFTCIDIVRISFQNPIDELGQPKNNLFHISISFFHHYHSILVSLFLVLFTLLHCHCGCYAPNNDRTQDKRTLSLNHDRTQNTPRAGSPETESGLSCGHPVTVTHFWAPTPSPCAVAAAVPRRHG